MGEDKGLIPYRGQPQVIRLAQMLDEFCASVRVSVAARQLESAVYRALDTVVDAGPGLGPAGGLSAAWRAHPEAAWLLVAVDLPLLDRATLSTLAAGRSPRHLATAFRHPDGTLEPLCTIWEAAARGGLERRLAHGDASLRRLLEAGRPKVLEPPVADSLRSVDAPHDRDDILRRLAAQRG